MERSGEPRGAAPGPWADWTLCLQSLWAEMVLAERSLPSARLVLCLALAVGPGVSPHAEPLRCGGTCFWGQSHIKAV